MTSLFLRIWLSFWAVVAAVFLVALAANYGLAVRRAQDLDRLSPAVLAAGGAAALASGGEEKARLWLLGTHNLYPELRVMVIGPDGRELTGRAPAEVASVLARRRPGRTFPAEVARPAAGRLYRFVFDRDRTLAFDLWDILLQPWLLVLLVLAISGVGSAWLARSFSRPVRRLQSGVDRVAGGEIDARMGPALTRRRDELGALARGIDHMTERLSVLIAARDAVLRDVSHELRAPLARLRAAADLARRQGNAPVATFDRIDREVDRLDGLVAQILHFSRLQALPAFVPHQLDFGAVATEAVEDARLEGEAAGKKVAATIAEGLAVSGDEDLLRSALDNVLRNAIRFSPAGGEVRVHAAREGDSVLFSVQDRGPGAPPADLPHIFEPFRGEGSGAGLGLAIVRRVVELHEGTVTARNPEDGGLLVLLCFPAGASPE